MLGGGLEMRVLLLSLLAWMAGLACGLDYSKSVIDSVCQATCTALDGTNILYIGCGGNSKASIGYQIRKVTLTSSTGEYVFTTTDFGNVWGLAIDEVNRFIYVGTKYGDISKVNLASGVATTFYSGFSSDYNGVGLGPVVYDKSGNILAAGSTYGNNYGFVSKILITTGQQSTLAFYTERPGLGDYGAFSALYCDASFFYSGSSYIAGSNTGGSFQKTSLSGGTITAASVALLTGISITAVSTDATGDVYVADKYTNTVWLFNSALTTKTALSTGYSSPVGITVASDSSIFVADNGASKTYMLVPLSASPTPRPTPRPTPSPTPRPTPRPTSPTPRPTRRPQWSAHPSVVPTIAPTLGSNKYYFRTYHRGEECASTSDIVDIHVLDDCVGGGGSSRHSDFCRVGENKYSIKRSTYAASDSTCAGKAKDTSVLDHDKVCLRDVKGGLRGDRDGSNYIKTSCVVPLEIMFPAADRMTASYFVTRSYVGDECQGEEFLRARVIGVCRPWADDSKIGGGYIPLVNRKVSLVDTVGALSMTVSTYAHTDLLCQHPLKTKTVMYASGSSSGSGAGSCRTDPLFPGMSYNFAQYQMDLFDTLQMTRVPTQKPTAAPSTASPTSVASFEGSALCDIYNQQSSTVKTALTNWCQGSQSSYNPCSSTAAWTGVTCSSGGRVTELSLSSKSLTGSLPASISNLGSLDQLSLIQNQLSGSLPTELARLTALSRIYLSSNSLTGTVPSQYQALTTLAYFYLDGNSLSGVLPSGWCSIANRAFDSTVYCPPTGQPTGQPSRQPTGQPSRQPTRQPSRPTAAPSTASPTSVASFEGSALCDIYNQQSSTVKTTLTNWCQGSQSSYNPCSEWTGVTCSSGGRVTGLSLSSKSLTGSLPASISNLGSLDQLSLILNQLSGSLPTQLGLMTKLSFLDFWANKLTGTIPTQIGQATSMTYLGLSSNSLSGSLPTELARLTALSRIYLSSNRLTGTVPSQYQALTTLAYFYLDGNSLSGVLPSGWCSIANRAFDSTVYCPSR